MEQSAKNQGTSFPPHVDEVLDDVALVAFENPLNEESDGLEELDNVKESD